MRTHTPTPRRGYLLPPVTYSPHRFFSKKGMRYRRIPYTVEAYQTQEPLDIETLEGIMHASIGDFIVTGLRGERWPVKPDIFHDSYEPVHDNRNLTERNRINSGER